MTGQCSRPDLLARVSTSTTIERVFGSGVEKARSNQHSACKTLRAYLRILGMLGDKSLPQYWPTFGRLGQHRQTD